MKAISLLLLLAACASYQDKYDPIRDVFLAKIERYKQCFYESDSFTQKKSGSMKVWTLVNPDGRVKEVKISESDFKDPNLHSCIAGQVKMLKFLPPADGGTLEIKQALNFFPRYL